MPRNPSNTSIPKATIVFRRAGGILRTQEAKAAGIHPRTLAAIVDDGTVLRLGRGVYQLADAALSEPDLAVVARKVPRAVVCLVSALAHHRLTTQIPHAIDLAVPRGFKDRKLEHPPVRFYRFGDASLAAGIERIKVAVIEGVVRDTCTATVDPDGIKVAEKFQVMLFRAEANSRLKDFHDVRWISRHFAFDGDQLAAAIRATCAKRSTDVPAEPPARAI